MRHVKDLIEYNQWNGNMGYKNSALTVTTYLAHGSH
jgi:hypothetical protein